MYTCQHVIGGVNLFLVTNSNHMLTQTHTHTHTHTYIYIYIYIKGSPEVLSYIYIGEQPKQEIPNNHKLVP